MGLPSSRCHSLSSFGNTSTLANGADYNVQLGNTKYLIPGIWTNATMKCEMAASPPPDEDNSSSGGLSTGAIIGIVVGVMAVLCLAILGYGLWRWTHRKPSPESHKATLLPSSGDGGAAAAPYIQTTDPGINYGYREMPPIFDEGPLLPVPSPAPPGASAPPRDCFRCGDELVEGAAFCINCGARISQPMTPQEAAQATAFVQVESPVVAGVPAVMENVSPAATAEIKQRERGSVEDTVIEMEV